MAEAESKAEEATPVTGTFTILDLQTKIQETKSSKRTTVYRLLKLPSDQRPHETIQLHIQTTWHRVDREKDEQEPAEVYEIPAYELAQFLMSKGKKLPR